MRKLEITNLDALASDFHEKISRSHESRFLHRLHCVKLVGGGCSCYQVAQWFGEHPRSVERWVGYFEAFGIEGLRDEQKTGRPAKIRDDQVRRLKAEILNRPFALGYGQERWDGKLLRIHLECGYGIALSVRQCQRLLHQLIHNTEPNNTQ